MAVFTTTASSAVACVNTTVGDSAANSYISYDELVGYLRCRVRVVNSVDSDNLLSPLSTAISSNQALAESYLINGTLFVDTYGNRFIGSRANSDQSLEWPRTGASNNKRMFAATVVPDDVKVALVYACGYLHAKSNPFSSTASPAGGAREQEVTEKSYLNGLYTIRYSPDTSKYGDNRTVNHFMTAVSKILEPVLSGLTLVARRA